jgi:hypothetical protein
MKDLMVVVYLSVCIYVYTHNTHMHTHTYMYLYKIVELLGVKYNTQIDLYPHLMDRR